jgi:RNA polymerase sigma factor for flagellar operon FliA
MVCWKMMERLPGRHIDRESIESVAMIGLWDSTKRITPDNRGTKSFVCQRVRGAILDYLREMDPLSRRFRSLAQQEKKKLDNEFRELEIDHKFNQVSFGNNSRMQIQDPQFIDVEAVYDTFMEPSAPILNPTEDLENYQSIRQLVGALSKREFYVIDSYYFKGMTLKEIGKTLDVAESRVSQIHTLATEKMGKRAKFITSFFPQEVF